MNAGDAFFDTNVILYLVSDDPAKADRVEQLLGAGGVISVQVLNEIANVALRKFHAPWPRVREVLGVVRHLCLVRPLTVETHDLGLRIAERHKFHVYDSMIVASALEAGCTTLFSEDMQHGQKIGALTIRNPF